MSTIVKTYQVDNSLTKRIDPKWALYLFIASLPLELIVTGTILTISKIFGLVALIMFFLGLPLRNYKINVDRTTGIFFLFLLYCVCTNLWSNYPEASLTRTFTIIQLLILYLVIINEMNSLRAINKLFFLSLFGGAALGISGLIDISSPDSARISGISRNANIYFTMAIFMIPSLYWTIKNEKKIIVKSFSVIVLCILVFTSLYTQSRGGLIALSVFFLCYFIFSKDRIKTLVGILVFGVIAYLLAPSSFWMRFLDIGLETNDRLSVLWPAGWDAFTSKIFFGHGIGTSGYILPDFLYQSRTILSVHNSLLAVGIDLGIFGIILYLAIIIGPTFQLFKICCLKKGSERSNLEQCGVILFCVLMAYLASWFVSGGFEYFKYLWVLVALETCFVNLIRKERSLAVAPGS